MVERLGVSSSNVVRWVLLLALLTSTRISVANDQGAPRTTESKVAAAPPATMLIRLAEDVVGSLAYREIDTQKKIDRILFDARVGGIAHTTGWLTVHPLHGEQQAVFELQLTGQTVSKTIAQYGPARVYSVRTTPFAAVKEIRYDGRRLTCRPAKVEVKPSQVTDEVLSKVNGVRGQVVRRLAEKYLERVRDEAEAIAQRDCEAVVTENFNTRVEARLERMNRRLRIYRYATVFWPKMPHWQFHLSTTDDYLQIAFAQGEGGHPRPPLTAAPRGRFSVQVWMHESMLDEELSHLLRHWPGLGPVLVEKVGKGEERPLLAVLGWGVERGMRLRFHRRDRWIVAQAGPLRILTVPPRGLDLRPPTVELTQQEGARQR